jgi:membrane protein implicated in regulation of membrane protease activity
MKKVWMMVAAVGVVIALVFLIRRNTEAAFVIAAIAAVAWFLNYRVQARKSTPDYSEQGKDEEHFDFDEQH